VREHRLAAADRGVHDVRTTVVIESCKLLEPADERVGEVGTRLGFEIVGNDVARALVAQVVEALAHKRPAHRLVVGVVAPKRRSPCAQTRAPRPYAGVKLEDYTD
jgi:hypothetical protein